MRPHADENAVANLVGKGAKGDSNESDLNLAFFGEDLEGRKAHESTLAQPCWCIRVTFEPTRNAVKEGTALS